MVIESLLSNISSNSTGNSTWNDLMSNGSPNSTGKPEPWIEPAFSKVFRFVIFGIIIFISLFGNALVIYVTYKNKTMRTFAYFLIANLAVADILSTLVLPFMIVYVDKYRWTFGESLCKILNPSLTVFSIVTTNTLVAIACDRFRALLFPFKLKPSTSETRLIIAIIWLLAVLVSLPSYGSRTVTKNYQCAEIYTADKKKQKLYTQIYTVFTFLFNNLIPLVVILFLYIKITMALKHISLIPQSLQLNRQSSLVGRGSPGSSPRNSVVLRNANVAAANKRQRMESKFIRMLLIVVLVFLFCYVPYQVFFLLWEFLPDDPDNWDTASKFYLYLFLLMWIPNAINPICYAALNARYARALKQLICKSFTKVKTFGTTIPSPRSTYTAGISRRKSSPVSV